MKEILKTNHAPQAIGTYSQGVATDSLVFTSGQIGVDPKTGAIVSGGIEQQINQVLINICAILATDNLSINEIIKLTVFLVDLDDFPIVNKAFKSFFDSHVYPARSTVQVSKLPMEALVEIECIASRN